jgi:hypothetical protein
MEISIQTDPVINTRKQEANQRYYQKHKEQIKENNRDYKRERYVPTGNHVGRPRKLKEIKEKKKRGRPKKTKESEEIKENK